MGQRLPEHSAVILNMKGTHGNSPLHIAALSGQSRELIRHAVAVGADPNLRNNLGQTPLLLAASLGFDNTTRALLGAGADPLLGDAESRTPAHVGCLNGNRATLSALLSHAQRVDDTSASENSPSLQEDILTTIKHACQPDTKQWLGKRHGRQLLVDAGAPARGMNEGLLEPLTCGLHVLNSSISAEELLRDYISISRPVILRGAAKKWPATLRWTREGLGRHYGHLRVAVGPVPYASTYGLRSTTASLRDFMARFLGQERPPPTDTQYVFDARVLSNHNALSQDVRGLEEMFPFYKVLHQFIYGPAGSGAPPHFHGHAANALIHGRKTWYLMPPSDAFFAVKHIQAWASEDLPRLAADAQKR